MKGVVSLRKKLPLRAVLILGAGALLLAKSGTVAEGIRAGIRVCLEQAVPALFPFLIFITTNLWLIRSAFNQWETILVFGVAAVVWAAYIFFVHYCYGMNFRG